MSINASTYISAVAVIQNDAAVLDAFIAELDKTMRANYLHYEILLVNNGSNDQSHELATKALKNHACIRYTRLTRRVSEEVALSAALDLAIGDVVVNLRPGVDPVDQVPLFVQKVLSTGGIVFGLNKNYSENGGLYSTGKRVFFSLTRRLLDFPVPHPKATLFMAMSRAVLNAIVNIKESAKFVRLFGAMVGYSIDYIEYSPKMASPSRVKSFSQGVSEGLQILTTNTTRPLRYAAYVGLLASLANLVYVFYVVIVNLIKSDVQPGWTTTSLQSSIMFTILFFLLTVIAQYIDRLVAETRNRPNYVIAEEKISTIMILDQERRNIVYESDNQ